MIKIAHSFGHDVRCFFLALVCICVRRIPKRAKNIGVHKPNDKENNKENDKDQEHFYLHHFHSQFNEIIR